MRLVTEAKQDTRVKYSASWLYKLVKRNKVRGWKRNGRVYIDLADLLGYQADRRKERKPKSQPKTTYTVAQLNRQAIASRFEKPYIPQSTGRHTIPNYRNYEENARLSEYYAKLGA